MKYFKNTLFSFSFLLLFIGGVSMPADELIAEDNNCTHRYDFCDQQHPDSYQNFDNCMHDGGCGIKAEQ